MQNGHPLFWGLSGSLLLIIYIYICLPTPLEMGSSQSRPPPPDDVALGGVWQAGAPQNEAGGSGRHQPPMGCPLAWVHVFSCVAKELTKLTKISSDADMELSLDLVVV